MHMPIKHLVVPDLQIPYQDHAFVKRLLRVARAMKPDTITFVGDLLDSPEVSRWTKGQHGEYQMTLQSSMDECHNLLAQFRDAAPNAAIHLKAGNHDERLESYINDYAPALRSLRSSSLEYQLRLEAVGVTLQRKPFLLAPDVLVVHGHERAYSSVPGKYELDRIKQYGCSVVSGHTHRPVLVSSTVGIGDSRRSLFGMNVGHGMDMSQVWYSNDGFMDWQHGFGIITTDEQGRSFPRLITAPAGVFEWQGKVYG
jgi:metallophosphoesterase superfamily enzyme